LTPTFGPLSATRTIVNGVSFDMVKVPPGRFIDGEGATRRELLVTRPFGLGVTPVTQALWRSVVGGDPSDFRGEDQPVEQVSWDDVQDFLARLSRLGLPGFRLPTEADWIWAVRCGVPTRWAGADRGDAVAAVLASQTAPVGGLAPSVAGLLDASGNVWEWLQDGWAEPPAGIDPQGSTSGRAHPSRGGSWDNFSRTARVAVRTASTPDFRHNAYGFRLLRLIP
jgi:formylglycine-generating enzyme required for sulfatase activity